MLCHVRDLLCHGRVSGCAFLRCLCDLIQGVYDLVHRFRNLICQALALLRDLVEVSRILLILVNGLSHAPVVLIDRTINELQYAE